MGRKTALSKSKLAVGSYGHPHAGDEQQQDQSANSVTIVETSWRLSWNSLSRKMVGWRKRRATTNSPSCTGESTLCKTIHPRLWGGTVHIVTHCVCTVRFLDSFL